MHDLIVIGAGLSGLSAALTAAQAGLRVRVVAKGMGALHWSAATIDLFGYSATGEAVEAPLSELAKLSLPHPYARARSENVQEALSWFQAEVGQSGMEYIAKANGDGSSSAASTPTEAPNTWIPSPVGAKRPAYLVPAAQAPGDLGSNDPLLIVGLLGMRDFYPELIAANLCEEGYVARAAHVPIQTITERLDFNTVHLAQALDHPESRLRLADRLAALVQPGERIGLPAIIGLSDHSGAMADLRRVTKAPIFEIPTLPPSVPGMRLHGTLSHRLERLGVRVGTGMEVIEFEAKGNRISWVATETSSRPLRFRAERFLLATGGVLGGGLTGTVDGRFIETVFDLPLAAPSDRSEWFRAEFLDPLGQPIFQAGVEVDDEFQPVDASGRLVYSNLWAAGGLLAHADPIRERSLEGLAISTGRRAALALVAAAGVKSGSL